MATIRGRVDPSRTTTLRRKMSAAFRRRFKLLEKEVRYLITKEDALGLKDGYDPLKQDQSSRTLNTRWATLQMSEKVVQFDKWLDEIINAQILATGYWIDSIGQSYVKGATRSYRDVNRKELNVTSPEQALGRQIEFFRSNLSDILIQDKVKVLTDRTFTDLKGVTTAMSTQIKRELIDGLISRSSPQVIAAKISDRIHKIGITRAETIARTEIIRAHAEGQLDAMERLNVEEVTILMEWVALYDACPICQAGAISGPYTLEDAHGLIPMHASCRCAWFPYRVRR